MERWWGYCIEWLFQGFQGFWWGSERVKQIIPGFIFVLGINLSHTPNLYIGVNFIIPLHLVHPHPTVHQSAV